MQLWTIAESATGVVLAASFATPSAGSHPKDNGWAWHAATQKATRIGAAPDLAAQVWSGSAWVEDPAKVEAILLASVDATREAMQMTVLTPGGAKKYAYNRKAAEAIDGRAVLATVLNALSLTDKRKRFPFAQLEAQLSGDSLSVVLARFDAGMQASATENARIEAVAQKAKRDIRAATTAAAKRAAFAAINWNWSA